MCKNIIKYVLTIIFIVTVIIIFSCQTVEPPSKPIITQGSDSGQTGIAYSFTANATDPAEDSVSLQFDWGDGNLSQWSQWKNSGQPIISSHIWNRSGTYQVKAMAKNKKEKFSDWSSAHAITILSSGCWTKTFGGTRNERGYAITQTNDGGFIITGASYTGFWAGSDVYLAKTDALGNPIWQKTFGGIYEDIANSVQITNDGSYIIAGTSNDNIYLLKTDGDGNLIWEKTFDTGNDEFGNQVQQISEGGYIIVGTIWRAKYNHDIYLIKTDASGNLVWQKMIGDSIASEEGFSVQQATDGGYIIAGGIYTPGPGGDGIKLIKTDASGNSVWERTFIGYSDDHALWVEQTNDGGYIVTGRLDDEISLIKTDNSGNLVWQKTYVIGQFSGGGLGWTVQQTSDGGYFVAGYSSWSSGDAPVLIKTNSTGDLDWLMPIGGFSSGMFGDDEHGAAIQTADGGYVLVCWTDAFNDENDDVYLIKIGGTGLKTK